MMLSDTSIAKVQIKETLGGVAQIVDGLRTHSNWFESFSSQNLNVMAMSIRDYLEPHAQYETYNISLKKKTHR